MAPTDPKNVESSPIFKFYTATSITTDVDLWIDYPGYASGEGKPPRMIIYAGGDLVVEDKLGNSTTLPIGLANTPLPIEPRKLIDAGTAATAILVIW
jgi:hypothetical protein